MSKQEFKEISEHYVGRNGRLMVKLGKYYVITGAALSMGCCKFIYERVKLKKN
jgi:hypothetical protein